MKLSLSLSNLKFLSNAHKYFVVYKPKNLVVYIPAALPLSTLSHITIEQLLSNT